MKHVRTIVVAALAAGAACSSPDTELTALPRAPVEIVTDDLGVAHVYAKDDEDLFFAAGYQMATDRLYQMEMLRRFAYGRLAEVLGDAALERDRLARAFDLPKWGRADAELTAREDPERAKLLRAWVRGINRRVDEVRRGAAPRPFGYRPSEHDFLPEAWDDADPYVVLKGAGFALDRTIEFEIALTLLSRVYPEAMASIDILEPARDDTSVPPEDRGALGLGPVGVGTKAAPPRPVDARDPRARDEEIRGAFADLLRFARAMPRASGSNNWVVDGRFTDTGKPLLAGDPHLSFEFFGAPYPVHLSSVEGGGSYDVAGFAYPGTPGVALGQTDKIAWAATSAFGDVTDVWEIVREGDSVRLGDALTPIALRDETIRVRLPGAPYGQVREDAFTYEDVPGHGVIIPRELVRLPVGGPYMVGWTGFRARPARWFMELNRARSLDDFEGAVGRMREMNYAFVAADATGIAYKTGVEVPVRGPTARPWEVMKGSDPGAQWTGAMLDASRSPRGRARERGWIATANNDPLGFVSDGSIEGDPFYFGAIFDPGYRRARIGAELTRRTLAASSGGPKVDVRQMQELQRDVRSSLADDLVPVMTAAFAKVPTDASLAEVRGDASLEALVKMLTAWDRRMTRESPEALAFHALLHFSTAEVLRDDIPLAYDFAVGLQTIFALKVSVEALRGRYPRGDGVLQGGRDLVAMRAAKKTAAWLDKTFGGVDRGTWASRKMTRFDHAFGYGVSLFDVPSQGGEDTIDVAQNIAFGEDLPVWPSSYVPVERTVATFDADGRPKLWVTFPVGAHADPASPETARANADYVEGRYAPLATRRSEVDARAVTRRVLTR